jgi:hypothetical protein
LALSAIDRIFPPIRPSRFKHHSDAPKSVVEMAAEEGQQMFGPQGGLEPGTVIDLGPARPPVNPVDQAAGGAAGRWEPAAHDVQFPHPAYCPRCP